MIAGLALSPSLDVTYLVDDLRVGAIAVPSRVVRVSGGKTLNASRVAASLGSEVTVVAALGGHTGAHVAALLEPTGVGLVTVDTASETRTCVSIASVTANPLTSTALTEIYEPSAPMTASVWGDCVAAFESLPLRADDWVVLAGSVPAGVPHAELVALLSGARSRGVRVAVDTHGPALAAVVAARAASVIKVNRTEALELVGALTNGAPAEGGVPPELALPELASALSAKAACLVIVTDGIHGSIAVDESTTMRVEPDSVVGDYAVGSGDSYLGGLVHELHAGSALEAALLTAASCASANAAVPGAALFEISHLDAARRRIRPAPIAVPR